MTIVLKRHQTFHKHSTHDPENQFSIVSKTNKKFLMDSYSSYWKEFDEYPVIVKILAQKAEQDYVGLVNNFVYLQNVKEN